MIEEGCKLRGVDDIDIGLESKQTVFGLFRNVLNWVGYPLTSASGILTFLRK